MLHPTAMGAITQLWAGTSPEAVNLNGKYLVPWACEGRKETKTWREALDLGSTIKLRICDLYNSVFNVTSFLYSRAELLEPNLHILN